MQLSYKKFFLCFIIGVFIFSQATTALEKTNIEFVEVRDFSEKNSSSSLILWPLRLPKYTLQAATWPLKKVVELNEEYFLIERAKDFFSNSDHTIWFYPTLAYSSSDGFSFGAVFKNTDFLDNKNYKIFSAVNYNLNSEFDADLSFYNKNLLDHIQILRLEASLYNNRNEKFFGSGADDDTYKKSIFRHTLFEALIEFGWHPIPDRSWLLTFTSSYKNSLTASGHSLKSKAAAEEVFPEIQNQGFDESLSFLEFGPGLTYDSRHPRGFPYKGEYVHLDAKQALPLTNKEFSYSKLQAQIAKLFNVSRKNRVIALGLNYQFADSEETIPFYELPSIGKNTFLRGYPDHRFRDQQAFAGTIEYRYPVWRTMEPGFTYGAAKIFIDFGQAYNDPKELRLSHLKTSFGLGLMIAAPEAFFMQTQWAFSDEGSELLVSLNREI